MLWQPTERPAGHLVPENEEPETLDFSDEASEFFLDTNTSAADSDYLDIEAQFAELDAQSPEETVLLEDPEDSTERQDSTIAAQTNEDFSDHDIDALSAEEGIDDDLLADILADLPDAEATLALDDPLLEESEDSVESIDLATLDGTENEPFPPANSDRAPDPDGTPLTPEEDIGAPQTVEASPTLPLDAPEDDASDILAPDQATAATLTEPSESTIELSQEEIATLQLPAADLPLPLAAPGEPEAPVPPDDAMAPLDDPPSQTDAFEARDEITDGATQPGPLSEPSAPDVGQRDMATSEELPPVRSGVAMIGWSAAALLLLALLGIQGIYAFRDELQAKPAYRPYVEKLCALLGCELPPLRDLSRIKIFGRHVESHPNHGGALLVNASIVNQAAFSQPYPDILLRFSDAQGATYAERVFSPAEYLRGPVVDPDRFTSEVPVKFSLELLDPGPGAVRYDFKFL